MHVHATCHPGERRQCFHVASAIFQDGRRPLCANSPRPHAYPLADNGLSDLSFHRFNPGRQPPHPPPATPTAVTPPSDVGKSAAQRTRLQSTAHHLPQPQVCRHGLAGREPRRDTGHYPPTCQRLQSRSFRKQDLNSSNEPHRPASLQSNWRGGAGHRPHRGPLAGAVLGKPPGQRQLINTWFGIAKGMPPNIIVHSHADSPDCNRYTCARGLTWNSTLTFREARTADALMAAPNESDFTLSLSLSHVFSVLTLSLSAFALCLSFLTGFVVLCLSVSTKIRGCSRLQSPKP